VDRHRRRGGPLTRRFSVGLSVLLALSAQADPRPAISVAVDLTQLGERDFQMVDGLGLENRATVRLIQEGFAVVSLRSSPQIVLRVLSKPDTLVLIAESGASRAQRVVRRAGLTHPELHLEVSQKLVELARALQVEPAPVTAPSEVIATPIVIPEPLPVAQGAESGWSVGAGGAAVLRDGGVDPLGLLWVERHGWRARPKVLFGFLVSPGIELQVFEVQGQLGVAWPWALRPGLELALSALAGAVLHTFTSPLQPTSGTRLDLLVSLPLELTWRPTKVFFLSARVAPALSSRSRDHVEGARTLWHRGIFRAEVGANLGLFLD
jgi:hypothetical protein